MNGTVSSIIGCVALIIVMASCQSFEEDVLPTPNSSTETIQVVAQEPKVIDVMEGVVSAQPVKVEVLNQPNRGDFSLRGSSFGLYSTRAAGTTDQFTVAISMQDGTITRTFNIASVTRSRYPVSEQGAVYDRGGILKNSETISVDVLANDSPGALSLTIAVPPVNGTAEVTGDNTIQYTASSQFKGLDDLIYETSYSDGSSGQALVRFVIE